jgi:hypothetical protein
MALPPLNPPDDFLTLKARVERYILRAGAFPEDWGRPDGAKTARGRPVDFFRYDATRFERMIARAEHFIRCLIIWLAYVRIGRLSPDEFDAFGNQEGQVLDYTPPLPRQRAEPVHPAFAARGLPLHEPRLAAFSVILPASEASDRTQDAPRRRGQTRSHRRPRNDALIQARLLLERLDRLTMLLDQIERRATRFARHWVSRLRPAIRDNRRILKARLQRAKAHGRPPDLSDLSFPALKPLPDWHPPDDLLREAPEDEAADLTLLHQHALHTAELFTERCG